MLDKSNKQFIDSAEQMQADELAKFNALAQEWWNPEGKFKRVLEFNEARVNTIIRGIAEHFERDLAAEKPLSGLRVLDIGCGAGLICEPLAHLGADVTGVDGSEMNVQVAKAHAAESNVAVHYEHALAEDLPSDAQFDVVLNTEVIEHVPDQQALAATCARLVAPKGLLVMATLDRSIKSFLVAIVGAEYVLKMLPKGTHDWRFFIKPKELAVMLAKYGMQVKQQRGFAFNPILQKWRITAKPNVNYMQFYVR
ncbi:MAG: bifunctional 2-polyprenyl-6-hydroxyphenol methylase/3-demethylubiquinol 3-O-methyltransferase UbiG [Idiomarina sp.]|nr:bifunctional 2-polyprenyl-6-hydroxyphenol methylase/3-demethylubiquinol 3-O-methyltransferase UbiG [Idiomarina sp.]